MRYIRGHLGRPRLDPEYIVDPETGCWVWQGALHGGGYGRTCVRGKPMKAHRAYWEKANGPIPEGLHIDHLCRNRACVNPKHLEPVTNLENIRRGHTAMGHALRTGLCLRGHVLPERKPGSRKRRCYTCERLLEASR
jgi:hypothetical protein